MITLSRFHLALAAVAFLAAGPLVSANLWDHPTPPAGDAADRPMSTWTLTARVPVAMYATTPGKGEVSGQSGHARTLTVDGQHHALVYFDLSGLPKTFSGQNLVAARLYLYVGRVDRPGELSIRQVTGSWKVGRSTAVPQISATPLGSVTKAHLAKRRFFVLDITSMVEEWLNHPDENHGLVLETANGLEGAQLLLGEADQSGFTHAAELEVEVLDPFSAELGGPSYADIATLGIHKYIVPEPASWAGPVVGTIALLTGLARSRKAHQRRMASASTPSPAVE